jgi:hypothetical protein
VRSGSSPETQSIIRILSVPQNRPIDTGSAELTLLLEIEFPSPKHVEEAEDFLQVQHFGFHDKQPATNELQQIFCNIAPPACQQF